MKQIKTIAQLQNMFPNVAGLDAALLYGSFGRNEPTPNSDIDIHLLVNKKFDIGHLKDQLQQVFDSEVQLLLDVALRKKLVVYFKSQPKIEFAICHSITEIDKNYLGSEITDFTRTILYQREPKLYDIEAYLAQITSDYINGKTGKQKEKQIADLVEKFIYEFESCSGMHRRSDAYQFYFFYNIALQVAIQLNHLSKGYSKFNFLPKYFVACVLTKDEQDAFYDLKGTLFLPEANQRKRNLLDFFYAAIVTLVSPNKLNEVKQFCEWTFSRDFFWNFRDINTLNPRIKGGRIFRTATMTFFQNEDRFNELLKEKQIKTVIDLRSDREIEELPYNQHTLSKINYVKAQFDPWNQPQWFKENYHYGTNEEIAYRFFAVGCKDKLKTALEAIIAEENGSVAIHCFAGKDRTGIFISMLHMLIATPIETIYADYLASEVDVKLSRLNLVLDVINESGGIEPYLLSCGLTNTQLSSLTSKLLD